MAGANEDQSELPLAALADQARRGRALGHLIDNVADAIVIIDPHLMTTYANRAAEDLVGRPGRPAEGRSGAELIHPEDRERVFADLAELLTEPGVRRVTEFQVLTRRGWMWVEAWATNLVDNPDVGGVVVSFRDLTHQRALEHSATRDPLTDLANRTRLADQLAEELGRAPLSGTCLAVLFVDLDNFKLINDSLGHSVGDRVLVRVADRLRATIDEAALIARFGGDEFVVLLTELPPGMEAEQRAVRVAQRLLERLTQPLRLGGIDHHLSASIGIALSNPETVHAEELLRDADTAMYRAKARRASWHVFSSDLRDQARVRHTMERELYAGIDNDEFVLYYQPIIDLRRGEPVELEALVRWHHPYRGLLAPGEFLPVAAQAGLSDRLDARVVERLERDLKVVCAAGRDDLRLSLNVSATGLAQPGWPQELHRALTDTVLDAGQRVTLEITEHLLMDDVERSVVALSELRRWGFSIAIDDFGTGHSSLSSLASLDVDAIKIDQSFLRAADTDKRRRHILDSIIRLAHALEVPAVAEGVETDRQRQLLVELGCDRMQGYLFGKPAPLEHALR
ncbi:MAG: putative bifunctional diguanylate cyclase/phosphodiesterase [Acidimicrobiia bacterium]